MLQWTSKKSAEVFDYRWNAELDPGDTLAGGTISIISGDVHIDSQEQDATGVTVWLSGGSVGPTIFRALGATTGGRTPEEFITLNVVADDAPVIGSAPTPTDLIARYPSFAAVDPGTLQYWLTDAQREADDSWPIATDIAPAQIAVAVHNMLNVGVAGVGDADITALLSAGVTDFQSGGREGFRVSMSPDAVKQALSGGYAASKPGQEYLRLLARNKGGPRVTAPGRVPCWNAGFNGFAGPLPNGGYPWGYGG